MRRFYFVIIMLLVSFSSYAADNVVLYGIQMEPNIDKTTITFTLSQKTNGTVKYIPHPDRLVMEFANTSKRFNMKNARLGGANVTSITTENVNNGVRFTFSLTGRVHWNVTFPTNPSGKGVLMKLEIISDTPAKKTAAVTHVMQNDIDKLFLSLSAEKKLIAPPIVKSKPHIFTVVIDPGHGGKDYGALGENGSAEKHVVLAIAKKLAKKINQTANMRAILTRNGDYFIPLRERMKLAHKGNADLFVAIHADAFFNTKAHGASVYTLSEHGASSEASRWLAQRANYTELGGVELNALKDRSPMVRSVLIDLAQTATTRDSVLLGNKMLNALDKITPLHKLAVEQAPFMVLKSPDIPSVLVETGFISNPIEEKKLSDPNYQNAIAQALTHGINRYVKKYAALRG